MKSISVIIPAKNEESYLPRSLECLKASAEKYAGTVEIILVDNGSTDQTVDVALEYGCKVKEVLEGPIARLRNAGALFAEGEILAFLDADCLVAPDWIDFCVRRFDDSVVGIVGTPAIPDLVHATWVERGWYSLVTGVQRPSSPNWIGSSNMFILRSVFEGVDGFDESLETAEDVQICKKISKSHKIILDSSVNTIHLRESKTLYELFKRERWRGKCSLRQFFACESKSSEYISTFVPLLSIFSFLLMIIFIPFEVENSLFFAFVLLSLPIFLMIRKRAVICKPSDFFKVYAVAFTFINSRGVAFFCEMKELIFR